MLLAFACFNNVQTSAGGKAGSIKQAETRGLP